MAYKKEELIKNAVKSIKENKLFFIEDVCVFMGISRQTFYVHGLDKNDSIKLELLANKIKAKQGLKQKWYENDNATTQIALYRLLSTPEEHKLLNQTYTNTEINVNVINNTVSSIVNILQKEIKDSRKLIEIVNQIEEKCNGQLNSAGNIQQITG